MPRQAGTLDSPRFWDVTLPDGLPGRAIGVHFVPKVDEDEPRTPGGPPLNKEVTLVAAFHRGDLDHRLRNLGMVLLFVGAAMAAATIVGVNIVVRRGLRPLSGLAGRAATIDASSLQLRFPTDKMPAELVPIGDRLNDLLARLEASFSRERRFNADAAHELRTPIAELRALAEVALKWPDDPVASEAALRDALNIALEMESIAIGLLALARCEASLLAVRAERVPVAAVFEEAFQPLAAKARAKQLTVDVDIPKSACWLTDRATLRLIFSNLLSNAVDHSEAAGSAKARVEKNASGERLLIANTNGRLVPEDMPNLFERFWQKDEARSSPEHCGLGLALARAYAQSLGMTLDAQLNHTDIIFTLSGASPCSGADGNGGSGS